MLVVNLLMRTGENATFVKSELLKTKHKRKNICKDKHGVLTVVTYINKIQKDATVCRYLFTAIYSTCFGCLSHQLSGVHTNVTAASGTGHSI